MKGTNDPRLSLCMIVRDEEENLSSCIEDAKPVVDEIIVVDTGSTDRTPEIARSFGAKVYHFKWMDDFAAARNESIKHATGDYILWLDADDRLSNKGREGLKRLKQDLSSQKNMAYALLVACQNLFGEKAVFYQIRIFPNIDGIKFEGSVHEDLISSLGRLGINIKKKNVELIHAGYQDYGAAREKFKRNLRILLNSTHDSTRKPKEYYHLARCYFGIEDYSKCLQCLNKARSAGRSMPFYKESYSMLADCYLQMGQGETAIQLLRLSLTEFPDSGRLHHLLGAALTLEGRYDEAISYLEKSAYLNIEIDGSPVLSSLDGRRLYYQAKCLEGLDHLPEAAELYEKALKLAPDDPDVLRSFAFLMTKLGRFDRALDYLTRAKERAHSVEKRIWLALARLLLHFKKYEEALELYFDILKVQAADVDALVGVARVSIEINELDHLTFSLETLMKTLGMSTNRAVMSIGDLAVLMLEIGRHLNAKDESENAAILQGMASKLGTGCEQRPKDNSAVNN